MTSRLELGGENGAGAITSRIMRVEAALRAMGLGEIFTKLPGGERERVRWARGPSVGSDYYRVLFSSLSFSVFSKVFTMTIFYFYNHKTSEIIINLLPLLRNTPTPLPCAFSQQKHSASSGLTRTSVFV